jgi:hypothetical protein
MKLTSARLFGLAGCLICSGVFAVMVAQDGQSKLPPGRWRQHDMNRPKPPVVEPAEAPVASMPPKDAVVLFDGMNLDAWQSPDGSAAKWKVNEGAMETIPGAGAIQTRGKFGDIQLHIEWSAPSPPHGKGQDRGNSGIFLMGQFELQVLDSYKSETYADGMAGSIYGQYPPLFNASRPPGEWQTYDVAFRRPRFAGDGTLLEPARITLIFNGILVQNNEEPFGPTSWLKWLPYTDEGERAPISLQDHDHPVRYRNVWLRELPERATPASGDLARPKIVTLPESILDSFTGAYEFGAGSSTRAKITRDGGHLVLTLPFRTQPLALEPISETEFDMPFTDGRFTFHKDEKGHVTSALFHIGDSERELKKVPE